MRLTHTLLCLGLAVGLAACGHDGSDTTEPVGPTLDAAVDDDPATAPADDAMGDDAMADAAGGTMPAASATATLRSRAGGTAGGTLSFEVADGGVRMTGGLTGLDPDATHAMHIHAVGDCSAPDFSSAGDHFNPGDDPHGDRAGAGPHHAGDMPNQVADAAGNSRVDRLLDDVTIGGGTNDILGKAVVVHEQADDYTTQPSGNAGGRIACGVIEMASPAPQYRGPADAGLPTPGDDDIPADLDLDDGTDATEGTGAAADTDNEADVDGTY